MCCKREMDLASGHSVPSWYCLGCYETFKKRNLIGESTSLEEGFESMEPQPTSRLTSLLPHVDETEISQQLLI